MTWFLENIANIIIILLVIGLLYLCIKSLINDRKSGCSSCGGKSCSGCSLCSTAANLKDIVNAKGS